jgi:hypothetical protein
VFISGVNQPAAFGLDKIYIAQQSRAACILNYIYICVCVEKYLTVPSGPLYFIPKLTCEELVEDLFYIQSYAINIQLRNVYASWCTAPMDRKFCVHCWKFFVSSTAMAVEK